MAGRHGQGSKGMGSWAIADKGEGAIGMGPWDHGVIGPWEPWGAIGVTERAGDLQGMRHGANGTMGSWEPPPRAFKVSSFKVSC